MSHDKKEKKKKEVDGPLVEAVVAHEMDAGQIEMSAALRALRGMEQPWIVRIGQLLDLLEFRGGLEPIRLCQLLVLHPPPTPPTKSAW